MDNKLDHYKVLQVQHDAHPNVIRAAYIQLSRLYHPDVSKDNNTEEKMKQLNNAYDILKNPIARHQYDLSNTFDQYINSGLYVPGIITYFIANRKTGLFTDKIIIDWDPPVSNSPILLYELQSSNVYSDHKWVNISYDSNNYATIDKVVTYARHTFRIRAINSIGSGHWATFKEDNKFVW